MPTALYMSEPVLYTGDESPAYNIIRSYATGFEDTRSIRMERETGLENMIDVFHNWEIDL